MCLIFWPALLKFSLYFCQSGPLENSYVFYQAVRLHENLYSRHTSNVVSLMEMGNCHEKHSVQVPATVKISLELLF